MIEKMTNYPKNPVITAWDFAMWKFTSADKELFRVTCVLSLYTAFGLLGSLWVIYRDRTLQPDQVSMLLFLLLISAGTMVFFGWHFITACSAKQQAACKALRILEDEFQDIPPLSQDFQTTIRPMKRGMSTYYGVLVTVLATCAILLCMEHVF